MAKNKLPETRDEKIDKLAGSISRLLHMVVRRKLEQFFEVIEQEVRKEDEPPPSVVLVMLRRRMCRDFEWIYCGEDRWNGYANDYSGGEKPKRVLITVVLVTGKAVIEVLSPDYGFDILI